MTTMTVVLKIKQGQRFTFYNVTDVHVGVTETRVLHSDRPPQLVQGYVETIKRVG